MQAYRLTGLRGDKDAYVETCKDAHELAREKREDFTWDLTESRVELVQFEHDKATTCSILSGWGCDMKVLRTWALTPRGGLKEVPNGE